MLYSLKEITLIPATKSNINSRSECDPYYDGSFLPLFTAPMSAVVGVNSFERYLINGINPIIPRNISIKERLKILNSKDIFVAFGLDEIQKYLIDSQINTKYVGSFKILIDIANGNMQKMFDLVDQLKNIYNDNIIIMAGNIANPETYQQYCKHKIDYCRIGIGGGSGCLTTTNTGIHYPIASLIEECKSIKNYYDKNHFATKIIADGGIKGYSDIIKALALGADYVMCGSLFTKMEESEAPIIYTKDDEYGHKIFYGMSTPKAQIELGGDGSKVSEGKEVLLQVEYTMYELVNNFKSYLKSTMSYCNTKNLQEFIGHVKYDIMSEVSINSVNK